MELFRLGVKFPVGEGEPIALPEFIPVFHAWIQQGLTDDLLLDVADYSHVHHGPGIVLIASDHNYSIDEEGGWRGLVCYRKRPASSGTSDTIRDLVSRALRACRLLEAEKSLKSPPRFRTDSFTLFANDRLQAPNNDATLDALRSGIEALTGRLYGAPCKLTRIQDPRERFSVEISAPKDWPVADLLANLDK